MKNIHILPTDKPSRLRYFDSKLEIMSLIPKKSDIVFQNIYITNDEKPKSEDWCLSKLNEVVKLGKKFTTSLYKKIILTTDQDLIKDGVQAISDEFIELFVKNLNCERVEVFKDFFQVNQNNPTIKIPQNASEMMLTTNDDIIQSIPPDDEFSEWDVTLMDGLENEPPYNLTDDWDNINGDLV
jgi:hypothetical protein